MIEVGRFGDLFWHQFCLYSTTPRTHIFAICISKCLFLLLKVSHFGIKNPSRHLPRHVFFRFHAHCIRTISMLGPFQNQVGAKRGSKSVNINQKMHNVFHVWIWLFATCFSKALAATSVRGILQRTRDASATSHPTNDTRRNHFSTIFQFFHKES